MIKIKARPEDTRDDRMLRVGTALFEMIRRIGEQNERAARGEKLHSTDFACVGYLIRAQGPLSPKQIIAYLGLSSGSGTALLDRLEGAGYIHRTPNPEDRRSVLINLDEKAANKLVERYVELEAKYTKATEAFSDHELEVIANFLEMVAHLSEENAAMPFERA